MRYVTTQVSFSENPLEGCSLLIAVSGCPGRCAGCHSPELRKSIGKPLSVRSLRELMENVGRYVTCVTFLGGDWSPTMASTLVWLRKNYPQYKYCLYSGAKDISPKLKKRLDYYKVGPFVQRLGGLNSRYTNQRYYMKDKHTSLWMDITWRFWDENKGY